MVKVSLSAVQKKLCRTNPPLHSKLVFLAHVVLSLIQFSCNTHNSNFVYVDAFIVSDKQNIPRLREGKLSCLFSSASSDTVAENIDTNIGSKPKSLRPPLSLNPLICESAQSILTHNECQILSNWCRNVVRRDGKLTQESLVSGLSENDEGAKIMLRLQQRLEDDILGYPKKMDSLTEYVLPRFISYRHGENEKVDRRNLSRDTLIPDGLHVDTNNSKHFRHW